MKVNELTRRELDIILSCVRRDRDERVTKELEQCIKNIKDDKGNTQDDKGDLEPEKDCITCSSGYLGYVLDMTQVYNNLIYKIEEELYHNNLS